jgi:hypothetical protein
VGQGDAGSRKQSRYEFDIGPYIKERLVEAGFVNVVERKICCTIGKWSNDQWEREVGAWEQLRLYSGRTFVLGDLSIIWA